MLYRFAAGGLENVIVQLINCLPRERFRHTIIALTDADPDFVKRIERDDVDIIVLKKPPGQPFKLYPRVFKILRHLKPDVMHSCNLAALEFVPIAALAGVPLRVHAEHGWEFAEMAGGNWRYRLLRKLYNPFVSNFIVVAKPLYAYLTKILGISERRVHLLPNGVDTERFRPSRATDLYPTDFPFRRDQHWVIGTVGRLVPIKNQRLLIDAYISLVQSNKPGVDRMRLAIVGEGPLREQIIEPLQVAGLLDRLWLPGARSDIPELLRSIDCFVLPSLSEATSCTLQEAMATGLQIIATEVGGNADLLDGGRIGRLVPSCDTSAMADAIYEVFKNESNAGICQAALEAAREKYSLPLVMQCYADLFKIKK
jgi:sugar transferase (PEP-CTERM/EpsH1 system associated)